MRTSTKIDKSSQLAKLLPVSWVEELSAVLGVFGAITTIYGLGFVLMVLGGIALNFVDPEQLQYYGIIYNMLVVLVTYMSVHYFSVEEILKLEVIQRLKYLLKSFLYPQLQKLIEPSVVAAPNYFLDTSQKSISMEYLYVNGPRPPDSSISH